MKTRTKLAAGAAVLTCAGLALAAEPGSWRPTFEKDGTVHVPAFDLPPSEMMSKEAVDFQKMRATMAMPAGVPGTGGPPDINAQRRGLEMYLAPQVAEMKRRYPADIVERRIAGVRTRVITPKGRKFDPRRILINVHGGAFNTCIEACAMMESLPIASVGGFKVITVDYRQAPEHLFPAASQDVTAVYRELLKTYRPKQIGLYGCSAGGALSGQVAAWLPTQRLPQLGAIGIFGAGAIRFGAGDSAYIAPRISGDFPPPPPKGTKPPPDPIRSYFEGTDMNNPMVSPAMSPAVLAKFPPTLVITGTRAPDLSPAILTHTRLMEANVPGDLIVGEGMGHCYVYWGQFPEAQSAYRQIVKFFRANLG